MIITLDGPAGSGKSTVARRLAAAIGFEFLDSGALYRAAAWLVGDRRLDLEDPVAVGRAVAAADVRLEGTRVLVAGTDVTEAIRTPEVTRRVSDVASMREVREALMAVQRAHGDDRDLVAEGRDMGTVVFPAADIKFFVTASLAERARRRAAEMAEQGFREDLAQVEADIAERDRRDTSRPIAPLVKPADAHEIDTTGLSIEAVIDRLLVIFKEVAAKGATE